MLSKSQCLVMFTEPIMNPLDNAEKMVELLIEKCNFKGVWPCTGGVMSYVAAGRSCAFVVEIGHGATQIVPIYESKNVDV